MEHENLEFERVCACIFTSFQPCQHSPKNCCKTCNGFWARHHQARAVLSGTLSWRLLQRSKHFTCNLYQFVCVCLLMGLLYLAHCKQRWDDKWMTMRKQKAPTLRLCGIIFLGNSIEWYRHHLRFYSFEECCSFILVQLKGPVVVQQLACLCKNGAARWIPGKSLFSDLLNA